MTIALVWIAYLLPELSYCPGQAPMDAHSSSAKIWGWAVTRRTYLNGSTIPRQGPTSDTKLAAIGTDLACIVCSSVIRQGQPNSGESCIALQSGLTLTSLPSFHTVQSSPAVHEFCAAGEECCKRGDGRVCAPLWCLMSWHRSQSGSEQSQLCGFTTQEFSMVGGYTENPEKPQNCQNWGVAACMGMSACSGQYGTCPVLKHLWLGSKLEGCERSGKFLISALD